MVRFFRNPCNLYILLLTFYSMQGTLIPTGGTMLSQLILFITMVMGLYYTFKTINIPNKPIIFSGLNLLFLLLVVYGVILIFSDHHYIVQAKLFDNEVSNSSYLKKILLSFPNIYTFYYFSRFGYLTKQNLKKWIVVFFGVAVFRYIDYRMMSIQQMLLTGGEVEEITNNMGYVFAALIPSIVLFKDKVRLQYGLLIFCMIFILLGMKRGAILVGITSLLYFLYYNYKYAQNISRRKVFFFSFIVILTGYLLVSYLMNTSSYFMSRIEATEKGYTSGRNELYSCFWNHFINETNLWKTLFGNGANATLGIGVNYAHNDWLEIAINQGIVGLIVYLFYWLCFIRTIISPINNSAKLVFTLTFISFFIKTLFSMSYTSYSMVPCTVFGYYLAHCRDLEYN